MKKKIPLFYILFFSSLFSTVTYSDSPPTQPTANALKQALQSTQSIHTHFEQRQWQDDEQAADIQQGQFLFQQPNKFHWIYNTPFKQEYIADGTTVRIYDHDLEQGIIRNQSDFTNFIFSDLFNKNYPVDQHYRVAVSEHAKHTDYRLTAKNTQDSPIQWITIRLKAQKLVSIHILDALDQHIQIDLLDPQYNIPVLKNSFEFQWPEGIDVFDERNVQP